MRRFLVCALAGWLVSAAGTVLAAPAVPGLVVFYAPAGAPTEVAAARDALARVARGAGAAFLDLSAEPPSPPAAPGLLRRAVEAYEALRWDEALAALEPALREAADSGAAGLSPGELSDLLLYRALVQTQRGDNARAWDDLVAAATVDPARVLDPLRFPPRTVEAFQRARERVAKQPRGTLTVKVSGCTVTLDGRPWPAPAELAQGAHYVRVECPGQGRFGQRVVLASEQQELEPHFPVVAPPDLPALRALGRARGSALMMVALAGVSPGAPPSLTLRVLDVVHDTTLGEQSLALLASAAADVDAASVRVLTAAGQPSVPATRVVRVAGPPARVPWYKQPLFWGVLGAAVATAVILPFAVTRTADTTFTVHPTGEVRW